MTKKFSTITLKRKPGTPENAPTHGKNTQIFLDGERLSGVAEVTIRMGANKVAHVLLEMICEVNIEELAAEVDFIDAEDESIRIGVGDTLQKDDITPKGCVTVRCQGVGLLGDQCRWEFFVDALDPRLPDGPFLCDEHCPPEERAMRDAAAKEILKQDAAEEENDDVETEEN